MWNQILIKKDNKVIKYLKTTNIIRTEKNVLRHYIVTYQTNGTQNSLEERNKLFHARDERSG